MKKTVKPNKLVLDKIVISKLDQKIFLKVRGGSKQCNNSAESRQEAGNPLCEASEGGQTC